MTIRIIEALERTALFGGLDDAVLRTVAAHAVEKKLDRDEILFLAGEPAKGLYVIAEGSVRAFRSGPDGREQVIHVENAVTTLAEVPVFDDGDYPSTVAAEVPSRVYFIPKTSVRTACLDHPQLALAAAKLLAGRLRRCVDTVESLSLREVGQRLAKLMLDEAASRGADAAAGRRFRQELTHNQLAARIGTVREVVTRAIYRLQSQGFISVDGKQVTVLDERGLRAYADLE